MGVHVVAIAECATLHVSPSGCAASSGNRWQPVKSVDANASAHTEIFLSTGIINDVICGMKDHESPELLAHVFFGGKKPEKRSFLQNPNRW